MQYCQRCTYPANARPTIHFDEMGVCSGCRYHESRQKVDWVERGKWLKDLLEEYKAKAREKGAIYDCIIPVSGGKDSHYQVHLIKNVYGLNPLLVAYNHVYNSAIGLRNLRNMVNQFNCDLVRFTASPASVRKLSRYMLKRIGDVTWHYHSGIMTYPIQEAVRQKIPLIIWGEEGFAELTGMFTLDYIVEFTKWKRTEHDMRGIEPPDDILNDPEAEKEGITLQDLKPYIYPTDEEIESIGVRGIYLSNFINWNSLEQTKLVVNKYNFSMLQGRRDGTFSMFHKTDDHCNSIHAWLKYLKFGYGRATDECAEEIRYGRMTREEAIQLVKKYDADIPSTWNRYLDFWKMSQEEFFKRLWSAKTMGRDMSAWDKDGDGRWKLKDPIWNHVNDPGVEVVRLSLVPEEDRTFGKNNEGYYYDGYPFFPKYSKVDHITEEYKGFIIL